VSVDAVSSAALWPGRQRSWGRRRLSGTASIAAATDARIDAMTEGIDATIGGSAQERRRVEEGGRLGFFKPARWTARP
jgi:hypothetical protein